MLGLDQSDLRPQTQHDLSALFPSSAITIYAAPNNGPLQALHQMEEVHSFKSLANKNIVVGFNYGTDIFRIQPHWNPKNFVPLNMTQLKRSFSIPGYHDIILFIARLRGVKFGGTESNSIFIRGLYFQMAKRGRLANIDNWLLKLNNSDIKHGKRRYFVLYPPYWYVGADENEKNDIRNDYYELACKTHNSGIFEEILVARMPKESVRFALDNRHFLTGEMDFQNIPVKALFNKSQLLPRPSYYLVGFLGGSLWTCQQRVDSLLKSETASYLLLNNINWLRGRI